MTSSLSCCRRHSLSLPQSDIIAFLAHTLFTVDIYICNTELAIRMLKLAMALFVLAAPMTAAPIHLRTNALEDPLGIDTPHPTFSWQSDAKTPTGCSPDTRFLSLRMLKILLRIRRMFGTRAESTLRSPSTLPMLALQSGHSSVMCGRYAFGITKAERPPPHLHGSRQALWALPIGKRNGSLAK